MHAQVVCDAADGVDRVAVEVDPAVAIEVHRVGANAARQELRVTERAGEGAAVAGRVARLLTREQEQGFELAPEQFGARWIVEGQGGERRQRLEVAGVAAVDRLDADDGDDDLGRHAELAGGTFQLVRVFVPERTATVDTGVVEETRPVVLP